MTVSPKHLLIGEILRPHGIRGELRMKIMTDYPERLTRQKYLYIASNPDAADIKRYQLSHIRFHQDYALLTLKEVPSRNEAELFRGLFVMVDIADAVPLEEDEIYLFQLIGMQVETEDGTVLGVISDVLETGANDVYVVDSPQYGEVLIPITDQTLLNTDTDTNRMIVRLPEGLLPG